MKKRHPFTKHPKLTPNLRQTNSVLMFTSHLRSTFLKSTYLSSSNLFPSRFPTKILHAFIFFPCMSHAALIFRPEFDSPKQYLERSKTQEATSCASPSTSMLLPPFYIRIFSSASYLRQQCAMLFFLYNIQKAMDCLRIASYICFKNHVSGH